MTPGRRTLVFVVTVHGFFLLGLPAGLAFSGLEFFAMPVFPGYRVAAVAVAAAGGAIYVACLWDFVFIGRGTPAVWDPPTHFIYTGPYKTVRNPMYVGMFSLIAAEALLWRSSALAVYLAILALGFHLFVIFQEEPALRRKFGDSYVHYCRRVPRWIPRLKQTP
jgi:protein-S-isoprenylcysteine O-methyltransferase Ste14